MPPQEEPERTEGVAPTRSGTFLLPDSSADPERCHPGALQNSGPDTFIDRRGRMDDTGDTLGPAPPRKDWSKSSVGERIAYLTELRGVTLNELGRRAVPPIASGPMSRLSRNPLRDGGASNTIRRLADAWEVEFAWLAFGLGDVEKAVTSVPVVASGLAHLEEQFPNLAEASRELRGRVSREALTGARSMALASPADLEVGTWVQILVSLDRSLRRKKK